MSKAIINRGWLRALIFCIVYVLVFILGGVLYSMLLRQVQLSDRTSFFLGFVISFCFSMLAVYVFRRAMDGSTVKSLGFEFKNHERNAAIGLLLGIAMLGIESLVLHFTGHLQWTDVNFQPVDILYGLAIMILVAISEEAVFRGYILHNLMQSMNRWIALAISSLLFALFHAGNPNITLLALLNIFLSGFLIGLFYVHNRNLWFAIAFHFSWNFFLGPVLGYEVSGLPLNSLLEQSIDGPQWLTGGEFGLEGSVLDGIFSVVAFFLLSYKLRAVSSEPRAKEAHSSQLTARSQKIS
jgi:uncharacterized protein